MPFHNRGNEVFALVFRSEGGYLCTLSLDDSCIIYSLRKFQFKGNTIGVTSVCLSTLTKTQCFLGGEACAKVSPVQVSQDTPGPPHIHSSNRQNFNATSKESVGSAWLTR